MTSKEKANELVDKYNIISCPTNGYYSMTQYQVIKCAIIAVDEILEVIPQKKDWEESTVLLMLSNGDNPNDFMDLPTSTQYTYWQEVKQHLEEML